MEYKYFYIDILTNIFAYLSDVDKIIFLSTCTMLHRLKNLFIFDEQIKIKNVFKLDKNFLCGVKRITFGKEFDESIKIVSRIQ